MPAAALYAVNAATPARKEPLLEVYGRMETNKRQRRCFLKRGCLSAAAEAVIQGLGKTRFINASRITATLSVSSPTAYVAEM
jgi:3-dehydroquinate dehydratase